MRSLLTCVLLLGTAAVAAAQDKDRVYHGTWVTTNRPLDGTMTCVVTDLGGERWRGHFSGAWHGQEFSYTVEFSGPPDRLRGKAVIDGANYEWTGAMGNGSFTGRFGGDRYLGTFDLKEKAR